MLIALHSRGRRAGKDTAGRYMAEWCEERGKTYERIAFGDKMKMLCALALGHGAAEERDREAAIAAMDEFKLHGQLLWWLTRPKIRPLGGYQTPEDALGGRDFIINLAEGARLLFGTDFWVDQALADWKPTTDYTVITDLRFDPEADRVRELGGLVVEIVNPRAEGGRSEQGIHPWALDYVLWNNKDLGAWRQAVRTFMDGLEDPPSIR